MSILLSQQATSEELVTNAGLLDISSTTKPTPYRSGHPVDKISLLNTPLDIPWFYIQYYYGSDQKYVNKMKKNS